jgi:hypothetical protein
MLSDFDYFLISRGAVLQTILYRGSQSLLPSICAEVPLYEVPVPLNGTQNRGWRRGFGYVHYIQSYLINK